MGPHRKGCVWLWWTSSLGSGQLKLFHVKPLLEHQLAIAVEQEVICRGASGALEKLTGKSVLFGFCFFFIHTIAAKQ